MRGERKFTATAFGVRWQADLPLPFFNTAPDAPADIVVECVDRLADRAVMQAVDRGAIFPDGFRLKWNQEVVFDAFNGDRVTYLPGPDWAGGLPVSFFSTVAALLLAWRGALPFHACAVEFEDEAFLIAGASGSGKSTLAAGLVGLGARLVSDDLSVLHADSGSTRLIVHPGRATMRLSRDFASSIAGDERHAVPEDPRGKWQVRPHARLVDRAVPVVGVLLLGSAASSIAPKDRPALLMEQLFRPRWLAALPQHRRLIGQILRYGPTLPINAFPSIGTTAVPDPARRAQEALYAMKRT